MWGVCTGWCAMDMDMFEEGTGLSSAFSFFDLVLASSPMGSCPMPLLALGERLRLMPRGLGWESRLGAMVDAGAFRAAGLMVPDSSMTPRCNVGNASELRCDTASITSRYLA